MSTRLGLGALAPLLGALAGCMDSGLAMPSRPAAPLPGLVAVLEQAGYHGPAGLSRWVAQDRDGTRSGQTLLLPLAGREQLQQALARTPALQSQLGAALSTSEITDPEGIDPSNNTPRADLGALVSPSILNVSPPLQSRVNFTNSFISYDFDTDQWYIVQNGTILASKILARDNAAGHYHGTEEQRSLPRRVAWWIWRGDFDGDDSPDRLVLLTQAADPSKDLLVVVHANGTAARVVPLGGWGVEVLDAEQARERGVAAGVKNAIAVVYWEKASDVFYWDGPAYVLLDQ